jgi:hypothetical protein
VTLFSDVELDGLRLVQQEHMPDTCLIGRRQSTRNQLNERVDTWAWGAPQPCGLGPSRTFLNEDRTAEMTVTRDDRELRLPQSCDIDAECRIRITHRYGRALVSPDEFDVQGNPHVGPSGLVVNLRRVTS